MGSWIDRSKDTLAHILTSIKDGYPDLEVRAGFVGYRDIGEINRFSVMTFTDDLPKITSTSSRNQPMVAVTSLRMCKVGLTRC